MVAGIRILGYRNLDEAYAFLRDQQDEATVYAGDEGADQTEVCLRLADGRWRNPLPRLVERSPYDGPLLDQDTDEIVEPENELDVIANAFLAGRPLTAEMAEIVGETSPVLAVSPEGDVPAFPDLPSKVSGRVTRTSRPSRKSWKNMRVRAQFARHRI